MVWKRKTSNSDTAEPNSEVVAVIPDTVAWVSEKSQRFQRKKEVFPGNIGRGNVQEYVSGRVSPKFEICPRSEVRGHQVPGALILIIFLGKYIFPGEDKTVDFPRGFFDSLPDRGVIWTIFAENPKIAPFDSFVSPP